MYNFCKISIFTVFAALILLIFCNPSIAQDQETTQNSNIITLDTNTKAVSIGQKAFFLHDSKGQFIVQDIIGQFKNGEITHKINRDKIFLKYNMSPTWIIFTVENLSPVEEWFLDMGTMSGGRSGVVQKFLIYDITSAQTLYNGLQKTTRESTSLINGRYFPLKISDTPSTYLLYIQPTTYKRVSIEPTLKRDVNIQQTNLNDFVFDNLIYVAIISTILLLVAFCIIKTSLFIPIIIYYVSISVWLIFIEKPFFSSFFSLETIALSFHVFIGFFIGLSSYLSANSSAKPTLLRLILMVSMALSLVALGFFIVFDNYYAQIKFMASELLSLMTVVFALIYLLSHKQHTAHNFSTSLALWIGLYFVGQVTVLLAKFLYIPYNELTAHADYLVLYPQLLALFISVIAAIRHDHNHKMDGFVRQMQKAQSILKAKKSKEEYDNTKLLRVIEREREVMEELRARETERTEEMRMAKIAADEANKAKSAFLAVISHEIRTPMTGFLGMLRMLKETNLTPTQEDYVLTIKESADALVALLNDILDFSKIENGNLSVETIEFDLHRVLNGIVMLMKGHADQKDLTLKLNIDENVPTILFGDPTRLRQVILNLVGNALKFTSKGKVTINVYIDPTHPDHRVDNIYPVYFSVEDTGIGISEEAQKNLFAPFEQADETISRKYGGTGLGLAICKKLIEAMRGTINVKSREGHGTSFFFTLPFSGAMDDYNNTKSSSKNTTALDKTNDDQAPDHENDLDDSSHEIPEGKSLRFLIVDDNEINRKVVKAFFDKENHESVIIYSGKQALELLMVDNAFDAIFLDIEMPDMNGKIVAQKILSDKNLPYMPLIALTGNVSDDDLNTYKEIGFQGCVGKPITPEKLLKITGNILFGDGSQNGLKTNDSNHSDDLDPEAIDDKTPDEGAEAEAEAQSDAKTVNTSRTLDEVMIKGLKDGLGTKQTIEMLKDLFLKADDILEGMLKAIRQQDREAARTQAHDLKGMCANFGLKAVSEKSKEIEALFSDQDRTLDDVEPHIKDLTTLIERSKLALNDFFNS